MSTMDKTTEAIADVIEELLKAQQTHQSFHSSHEGWAVIKEELDELWDEVKKRPEARDPEAMEKEAVQVAAMAVRFVLDVCRKDRAKAFASLVDYHCVESNCRFWDPNAESSCVHYKPGFVTRCLKSTIKIGVEV